MSNEALDLQELLYRARRREFSNRKSFAAKLVEARRYLGPEYNWSEGTLVSMISGVENVRSQTAIRKYLTDSGKFADYFRLYVRRLDLARNELDKVEALVRKINPKFSWEGNNPTVVCDHEAGLRRYLARLEDRIARTEEMGGAGDPLKAAYVTARNEFLLVFPEITDSEE